jgi:hypothetical protein
MKPGLEVGFLVIHKYNKVRFLKWLMALDETIAGISGHLFIYDMSSVESECLTRQEMQQFTTPVRLITGSDQSIISAYNRLLNCVPKHFAGVFLMHGVGVSARWIHTCLVKQVINAGKEYLYAYGNYFLMYIPLRVIARVGLFEERFFMGSMFLFDYAWRSRSIGEIVIRDKKSPGTLIRHLFPVQGKLLATYYDEKNRWLFARLRLSFWQRISFLIGSWWWYGVWKRGVFSRSYHHAWWDGIRMTNNKLLG